MDYHQPVLLQQTTDLLDPTKGKVYIDATLGHGGHSLALLSKNARVFGLDQDPNSLQIATDRIADSGYSSNFTPIHANFSKLQEVFHQTIVKPVDGLLLDLGLNSFQQKAIGRGFSFNDSLSLDMRLDPNTQENTAENLINTADFDNLYQIFTKYAQEQYSKPLIIRIIHERQKSPIKNGQRLANIIRDFYQERHLHSSVDPATKIFMALRIAVNLEYQNLSIILPLTLEIVRPGGVVCVITFHSGEDRLVKSFIQKNKISGTVTSLTPKGIRPSFDETKSNPLSRSATLRSYKIN